METATLYRDLAFVFSLLVAPCLSAADEGALQTTSGPIPQPPTLVYALHTPRQTRYESYLARTPDGAVLVFAPQSSGRWSLIRVTLGLPSPREEQLTISGFTPDQLGKDEVKGLGDVNVGPDGHYAIVRTQTYKIPKHLTTWGVQEARATVAVIDLQDWKVLSERSTTEFPFARGMWAFNKDGTLIADSTIASTWKPGQRESYTDTHQAVSLLLPDLRVALICDYRMVFGPVGGLANRETSVIDVSPSCSDVVKLAGVSSLKDLVDRNQALKTTAQRLQFRPDEFVSRPHTHDWNGCGIDDLSIGEQFALYQCWRSHSTWYDAMKTTALSASVVSVPSGKEVLRIPLPLNGKRRAILVTISGECDLAILEDGVNLVVYRAAAQQETRGATIGGTVE